MDKIKKNKNKMILSITRLYKISLFNNPFNKSPKLYTE
jgi:hypothetical protein